MIPNATLLTLLSVSGTKEQIFFAYLKELEEIAPDNIYWYPDKGQNGKAIYLWKYKNIKQWLLIGNDDKVNDIWKRLLEKKILEIDFRTKKTSFIIPVNTIEQLTENDDSSNIYKIPEIPLCGFNEFPIKFKYPELKVDISFLLDEKNNCNYIEGYKTHDQIKPICPPGLFNENFLYNCIINKIVAVKERRKLYWTLRGDQINENKEPKNLSGFIQVSKEFKQKHKVIIRDIDGAQKIGESIIENETGKWNTELISFSGEGQFLLENIETGKICCGEKYYLVKDFKININLIDNILEDSFNRKIDLIDKREIEKPILNSVVWNLDYAPDSIQAQIELSDKLNKILLSLGEHIIINDPFLLGDFEIIDNRLKLLTKSQLIFLNALLIAIVKGEVKKVQIIGFWRKAKNFIKGDKQQMFLKYEKLYEILVHNIKNSQHYKLKEFEIILSNSPFHDRYWMGIEGDKENIIYRISNSINGAFESGELSITPLDEKEQYKIKHQIIKRIEEGEKRNFVK